ncbi:MAG TPA: DEAD/DEAH box helicase family protein, partial [Bdellovibrionales bacterium]|nr:DEAD/DEAH box helicase family protein [Bdellovibrionales bacterium]
SLGQRTGARALIVVPTGVGKTVISGLGLKDIAVLDKRPVKVVFLIQNSDVLDEATVKLQNLFGLSPAQVQRVYGGNSKSPIFPENAKLITSSRTTFHARSAEFKESREKFKGRILYVMDEAQHLGRDEGEFAAILNQIDRQMRDGDLLLGLSATPWHKESDLITKVFRDNVITAFLSAREKQEFLKERKLIYMARLQLFRAMAQGYLAPIRSYRQVRYLEGEGTPILARRFLNDWDKKFEGMEEKERFELLKKEVRLHQPLVAAMLKEIRATFQTDAAGNVLNWNRGLIFVPSIAHAEIYAFLLNRLGGDAKQPVQAKAYHSNLGTDQRGQAMDWFKDELRAQRDPNRRVEQSRGGERQVHKYLFAVRSLGEGFDEPRVNHLILAKAYNEDDMVGMRELLQNLGRATRIAYGKPYFNVSDFTGDMRRLIFAGLDQSLINRFFVAQGERDFEPFEPPTKKVETEIHIDATTLDANRFTPEIVSVPVEELTHNKVTPSKEAPSAIINANTRPTADYKLPVLFYDRSEQEYLSWKQILSSSTILSQLIDRVEKFLRGAGQSHDFGFGNLTETLARLREQDATLNDLFKEAREERGDHARKLIRSFALWDVFQDKRDQEKLFLLGHPRGARLSFTPNPAERPLTWRQWFKVTLGRWGLSSDGSLERQGIKLLKAYETGHLPEVAPNGVNNADLIDAYVSGHPDLYDLSPLTYSDLDWERISVSSRQQILGFESDFTGNRKPEADQTRLPKVREGLNRALERVNNRPLKLFVHKWSWARLLIHPLGLPTLGTQSGFETYGSHGLRDLRKRAPTVLKALLGTPEQYIPPDRNLQSRLQNLKDFPQMVIPRLQNWRPRAELQELMRKRSLKDIRSRTDAFEKALIQEFPELEKDSPLSDEDALFSNPAFGLFNEPTGPSITPRDTWLT